MALYFSERAALELLDFSAATSSAPDATLGSVEVGVTFPGVGATLKASPGKWLPPRGQRDELLRHIRGRGEVVRRDAVAVPLGSVVDLDLENIHLGTIRVASVGGVATPFWVFLLVATVPPQGSKPPVHVIAVGSPDNYRAFDRSAAIEPRIGEWHPSSPEGRAMLYEKLGILTRDQVERELQMFEESYPKLFEPGEQVNLFRYMIGALQNNDLTGDTRIDASTRPVPAGALLGIVEDIDSTDGQPPTVLVRLIHLERRSLAGS